MLALLFYGVGRELLCSAMRCFTANVAALYSPGLHSRPGQIESSEIPYYTGAVAVCFFAYAAALMAAMRPELIANPIVLPGRIKT